MRIGTDTGFFISYANNHSRAVEVWSDATKGAHKLVVSALTVNELFAYFYKRGAGQAAQIWLELMQKTIAVELIAVSVDIAALSARYRLGMQLATVDSIILATFLAHSCEKMISSDSDFAIVAQQNVLPVEILK